MSLSSTTNRKVYVGDGSSASFSFPYEFFTTSDLKVFLYDTLSGSVQNQLLNTNYTVSATANSQGIYPNGGSVVMASAIVSTTQIVITRDPSQIQNFVLQQNATIPSAPLTQQLDYLTLLVQRQQDLNSSSVRLNDGFNGTFDPRLPTNVIYASNCFLVVNSAATGFTFALNTGGFGPAGLPLIGNGSSQIATYQALLLSGSGVTGVLPISAGGTNNSSYTQWGSFYYNGTAFVSTGAGTAGNILTVNSGAAPSFQSFSGSAFTGQWPISLGGTNNSNFTQFAIVYAGASQLLSSGPGTPGNILTANSGAAPTFQSLTGSSFTGIWPTNLGGTGTGSNFTQYGIIFASSANQFSQTPAGSSGLVLLTQGSAAPIFGAVSLSGAGVTGILPASNGGTGFGSNYIQYGVLFASSATQFSQVQAGSSGLALLTQGSNAPIFGAVSLSGAGVTGTLPVLSGGSGNTGANSSLLQFGVVVMSSLTQMTAIPNSANAGYVLTANAGALPTWQAASTVTQSGILTTANGGTGVSGSGIANRVATWTSSTLGNILTGGTGSMFTVGGTGGPGWETPAILENLFINGGFDFWQALPTGSNSINTQVGYFADQWYVQNTTGSAAIAAVTKSSPTLVGSMNGLSVQVTTQATATQSNTLEVWQVLDNKTTMGNVINACSLIISAQVKALGQINTLGIQLFSCSGEVKAVGATIGALTVQSSIAAEQSFTINSNAFSLVCATTTFTYLAGSNGVVAVRFRPIAAQSGFVYSNNAGVVLEQAGLYTSYNSSTGTTNTPPIWSRQGFTPNADFYNCLRFYEKSYDLLTAVGATTLAGANIFTVCTQGAQIYTKFEARKRVIPTITDYSPVTGASAKNADTTSVGDVADNIQNPGQKGFTNIVTGSSNHTTTWHWVADARI